MVKIFKTGDGLKTIQNLNMLNQWQLKNTITNLQIMKPYLDFFMYVISVSRLLASTPNLNKMLYKLKKEIS